jgi:hypothetical protein
MVARSKHELKISNALLKPGLPQFDPKIAYLHDALYAPESAQIHTGLAVGGAREADDFCESSGRVISLRKKIADLSEDEQRSIPTPVTL